VLSLHSACAVSSHSMTAMRELSPHYAKRRGMIKVAR
jgi:hypothetical protein